MITLTHIMIIMITNVNHDNANNDDLAFPFVCLLFAAVAGAMVLKHHVDVEVNIYIYIYIYIYTYICTCVCVCVCIYIYIYIYVYVYTQSPTGEQE